MSDYIMEASFINYFTNVLLKQQLREVAQESVEAIVVGEVVEDMIEKEADLATVQIVNEAIQEEQKRENEQAFKIDVERAFVDQAVFSTLFTDLMKGFDEDEENLIAQKEAELKQDKEMRKQIASYEQSNQKYREELNQKLAKEKIGFEKNYDNKNLLSYDGIAKGDFSRKKNQDRYSGAEMAQDAQIS